MIRRDALEKIIAELIPGSPWEQTVARLRCLRGIDTLSAVGLCAEVGEFDRFQKAGQLMSYLGLTPSEDTSQTCRPSSRHDARYRTGIWCLTLDTRTSIRVVMRPGGPARNG